MLTTAEANNIIENLHVYLDTGSGTFEITDTLVTSVGTLSLSAGIQTVTFTDGDAAVQIQYGSPRTYFIVVETTGDAGTQSPNQFQITQITDSSSTGEDRDNDIPLLLEYMSNVSSGNIQIIPQPTATPTQSQTPTQTPTPTETPTPTPTCGFYQLSADFSSQPPDTNLYSDAYTDGQKLGLTNAVVSQEGSFILNESYCAYGAFSLYFDMYIGDGTSPGADGISVCFAGDIPDGPFGEEGIGCSGLIVSFDTYSNGGGDPAPSVTLKYAGSEVAVQSTSLRTGTWIPVSIIMASDNRLSLYHNHVLIFDNVEVSGYSPGAGWRLGFSAGTGTFYDNQWIDNITFYNAEPSVTPTATPTEIPTFTPTNTPTSNPTSTPTVSPPTATPEPSATPTPLPPTETPAPICIHHGDVNASGGLTAEDAQITFNIVLGFVTPTFEQECAADCDGGGTITAGDAQVIFNAVLGIGDGCVEEIPG